MYTSGELHGRLREGSRHLHWLQGQDGDEVMLEVGRVAEDDGMPHRLGEDTYKCTWIYRCTGLQDTRAQWIPNIHPGT